MSLLAGAFENVEHTFYDSFSISPSDKPQLPVIHLFQRRLGPDTSMLETNLWNRGALAKGQQFRVKALKIEFMNSPEMWDVSEFVRKCVFRFLINRKPYAECFLRSLIEPRVVNFERVLIDTGEPFEAYIHSEKPMNLDPQGSGLHGHLFMQGTLVRPIQ